MADRYPSLTDAALLPEVLRQELRAAEPPALAHAVDRVLRHRLGVRRATIWLVDYGERALQSLALHGDTPAAVMPVETTPIGHCYLHQRPEVHRLNHETSVLVPLTARAERIGVLEVRLDHDLAGVVAAAEVGSIAEAVADAVVLGRPYTDLVERGRRTRDLTLAAELQWELLQPATCEGRSFSLAGRLEPAYEVGGDHYDYAAEPDRVTFSVLDGMGHGLRAALLGSLATGAMRNTRRNGGRCADQARAVNGALCDQFAHEQFVTGLIIEVDLAQGLAVAVNAGHPQALRVRGDRVEELGLDADRPFGLFSEATYRVQPLALEPGDRLVLVSDGVLDATPEGGEVFGADRLAEVVRSVRSDAPAVLARAVAESVLEHRGSSLSDDVTILCFDWRGLPV